MSDSQQKFRQSESLIKFSNGPFYVIFIIYTVGEVQNETLVFINFSAQDASIYLKYVVVHKT